MRRRLLLAVLAAAAVLTPAGAAHATGVAYLDGREVWVSTLDGATKVRLSAGEGDWLAVAQGDGGHVIGVRNVAGRNGQFATFRVWQPNGRVSDEGPLRAQPGYSIYVMPLSLDITPDGASMVYGYSDSRLDFSTFPAQYQLAQGYHAQPVTTRTASTPFNASGQRWPTLFGRRVISASGDQQIAVQNPGEQAPYGADFTPWLTVPNPLQVRRTDVAASGKVAAAELFEPNPGSGNDLQQRIAMFPIDQPGGSITPTDHDCFLPANGPAQDVSLSQDGTRIAYVDQGGLRIAPVTDFAGLVTDCAPTAPVTISATGKSPSIGPINVPALLPSAPPPPLPPPLPPPVPPTGPPTTQTGPVTPTAPGATNVSIPAGAKATSLRTVLPVSVTVPRAGRVTVSLLVSSKLLRLKGKARQVVIATGTVVAKAGGKVTAGLKVKPAYKRALSRLRGKRITLKTDFAGKATTKTITLK